jgi:hypothetical protein
LVFNIIGQYKHILKKNAQKLTPYRFGYKCNTPEEQNILFFSMPRFEGVRMKGQFLSKIFKVELAKNVSLSI